ncbi:hypothetical protein [Prevotella sp. FD3004]|uniref:hypothetical protein n=1 Tax=Prevotella sp. FD3004 TaxID=1408309 RepID=UPI00055B0EA6|nr:hypothetical protein [Prevotella sp. FD3004]
MEDVNRIKLVLVEKNRTNKWLSERMRTMLKTTMIGNNMKKTIVLSLLICVFAIPIQAKTTYIPTYDNHLLLIENGEVDSLANKAHSLMMSSKDGLIICTLAQQVVSEDLVRDIKRAKNAAGWAMVAAAFSSASEGMAQSQMNSGHDKGWAMRNYVDARDNTKASLAASADAKAQAEDLKTLLLDLVIRNKSEKEMLITDMDRGLVWFVLPNCEVRLPLLKDEECHFRISSCNPLDENVKYINALGTSTLEKYTVGLETDISWYVPISNKVLKGLKFETDQRNGYIKIDKETMAMSVVSEEEFKVIKENQ